MEHARATRDARDRNLIAERRSALGCTPRSEQRCLVLSRSCEKFFSRLMGEKGITTGSSSASEKIAVTSVSDYWSAVRRAVTLP
jgi:hypothetical protein